MSFNPQVDERLLVEGVAYCVAEHPAAPGVPYGQEGRQAIVYQLVAEMGEKRALKVFKPRYRFPALVSLTERIASFARLPGLQVCDRTVLSARRHGELLRELPELAYAVLMPWVEGPTWMQIVQERRELSAEQSLTLARALADILVGMEERGLAHCDLSGPNVMLPMLAGGDDVRLVDVEQIYAPALERPEALPGGSAGYAQGTVSNQLWSARADRFAGAILLGEMLGWCDARIRGACWGESYFSPKEMGQENERSGLLVSALGERWGERVASLFERAWRSEGLSDCPTFAEWLVAIPDSITEAIVEPEATTTEGKQIETKRPKGQGDVSPRDRKLAEENERPPDLSRLFQAGVTAYKQRDWGKAEELLAEVLRLDPGYHSGGSSAAELLGEAQRHRRSADEPKRLPSWATAGLVGLVGGLILGLGWLGWRYQERSLGSRLVNSTPTPIFALTPTQTPVPSPTPSKTPVPTSRVIGVPTNGALTPTPTAGTTPRPVRTKTPTRRLPSPDASTATTSPTLAPTPAQTPITGGWVRFSSLEYCIDAECRPIDTGSTINPSRGVIRWQMDVVAPDLNDPSNHARYYIGSKIGLQVAAGDREAYVQPFPGRAICSEGSGDAWGWHEISPHCRRGSRRLVSVDVGTLPEWADDSVEIMPAGQFSRRDFIDGRWDEKVEVHWESGPRLTINLSH